MTVTWLSQSCPDCWLADSLSNSSLARTKKTPRMGESKRTLQVKTRVELHCRLKPPVLADPPVPEVEPVPTQSEVERRVEEAEKLGEVGVTRVIANLTVGPIAAEARPSMLSEEELARRKLWPTVGCKAPRRNSSRLERWRSPEGTDQGQWLSWDPSVSEKHQPFNSQTPLFMSSPWDSPWSGKIWYALPSAHHLDSAGSCRGTFGWAPGRCQPMHHPCEMLYCHAQRHSARLVYLWKPALLLKILLPRVCFSLSVGCRLWGISPVLGKWI